MENKCPKTSQNLYSHQLKMSTLRQRSVRFMTASQCQHASTYQVNGINPSTGFSPQLFRSAMRALCLIEQTPAHLYVYSSQMPPLGLPLPARHISLRKPVIQVRILPKLILHFNGLWNGLNWWTIAATGSLYHRDSSKGCFCSPITPFQQHWLPVVARTYQTRSLIRPLLELLPLTESLSPICPRGSLSSLQTFAPVIPSQWSIVSPLHLKLQAEPSPSQPKHTLSLSHVLALFYNNT